MPRNQLWWGTLFLIALFGAICSEILHAQPYREWRDTTLPEVRQPRRVAGQDGFPIGMFVYHYDYNHSLTELVPYMNRIGIDHILHGVLKSYDGYRGEDNWGRYQELLDSLEASGKRMIPMIDYGGTNNLPTYLGEAERGREVLFYPFDSSQMRRWEVYENLFMSYHTTSKIIRE